MRTIRSAAAVGAVALLCAMARAAEPSTIRVALAIEPQSLRTALASLADQTGLQIMRREEDASADGLTAPRVAGELSAKEALDKLLAHSGLTYEFLNERTVRITRVADHANESSEPHRTQQGQRPLALAQSRPREGEAAATNDQSPESPQRTETKGRGVQEVVVTATRRAANVTDVPMSIAVVTTETIEQRGLVNAEDYLRGMPGVNQVDSPYGQSVVIRGIESSPRDQNYASGATTATYFGEAPTTSTAGLGGGTNVDLKLVDIERVEVLRGPQGTAFGNSSMGGAVRTIPRAPDLTEVQGKVAAGYSGTAGAGGSNYNVQAIANVPLVQERLALRAVGYRYEDSGFYRNRAASDPAFLANVVNRYGAQAFAADESGIGDYTATGGRAAMKFQATEALQFTLSYLTQRSETDGTALATVGPYDQAILRVAPEDVVRGQREGVSDMDIDLSNATMEYNFDWANLIVTYSHTKSGSVVAQPFGAITLPVTFFADSDHLENVGEIRLVTQLKGNWDFLAGVYVEDVHDEALFTYIWFGDPATNIFRAGQQFVGADNDRRELKQKAAFGEASWQFLPGLTLTGGVRAYKYDRTLFDDRSGPLFTQSGLISTAFSNDASGENFRANLSYKRENALFYAGWSQGFRLGKPQGPLPSGQCDRNGDGIVDGTNITLASTGLVNSDNVDNYEIGAKLTLLERRLTLDTAVFRMEWSDIPVRVAAGSITTGCGLVYLTNAGSAVSKGVELQANYQVTDAFSVDLGGSWTNARLTEDVPAQNFRNGARLPGLPKLNANLGLQQAFNFGDYRLTLRADSIYVGEFYGDLLQSPNTKTDSYVKIDASARFTRRNLNVDLFVHNLTNEDALTFRGAIPRGVFYGSRMRPRTIGLQLGYNF